MTLILAMVNRRQAVLVSDRRLTSNGLVVEEESNKAAVLVCRDARLAVAFTGLAEHGAFKTRFWLAEALVSSAAPDYSMSGTIERFRRRASREFVGLTTAMDKRLTVILAGYSYADSVPRAYCWVVSNFETVHPSEARSAIPGAEFKAQFYREIDNGESDTHIVYAAGTDTGIDPADTAELVDLLRRDKPAMVLIGKAIDTIRTAAASPKSFGTVGRQCMSIMLPSDPSVPAEGTYHPVAASFTSYAPSFIKALGDGSAVYTIVDPSFRGDDSKGIPQPMAIPQAPRNQPCPCGSGKKYKHCHGRR